MINNTKVYQLFKIHKCTLKVYIILSFFVQILHGQSRLQLEQLQKISNNSINNLNAIENTENQITDENRNLMLENIIPYDNEAENITNHFGYSFFTQRDTVSFWDGLPTPSNYFVGPGDELIISLWGKTQLRKKYVVSNDGKIYDDKVGLLNLSGKTIEKAELYIKSQFGRIYSTLEDNPPSTYIDVSLGQLKSINVNFVGELPYPGVYPIHPASNIITGLIKAGGVDTTGSLRKIYIKRNNAIINTIDLYDYFLFGNLPENIQLRDQDIVVVPPRKSYISVDSAVLNPGIYEAVNDESIFDVIENAGGRKIDASEKVNINRVLSIEEREKGSNYEGIYINYKDTKLFPAKNVNKIIVRYLPLEKKNVEIVGQVKSPGKYDFFKNMKLSDLLLLSSGFEDTTFIKSVNFESAEIIRMSPNSPYEIVIPFKIKDVIEGNKDFNLHNLDKVSIHANMNYFEKENIKIFGEINIPGSYPIISNSESLSSIIERAGGITSKALINGISIFRKKIYFDYLNSNNTVVENNDSDMIRVAWLQPSVQLMPGDSIYVREKPGAIKVEGEVYNQGFIEFRKNRKSNYYIKSAGGLTQNASKKDIIVIYANGVVKPVNLLSSPVIEDGSIIIVNSKPVDQNISFVEIANTSLSLISSLVTILVLSQQLNN